MVGWITNSQNITIDYLCYTEKVIQPNGYFLPIIKPNDAPYKWKQMITFAV